MTHKTLPGRSVKASAVENQTYKVFPNDLNSMGKVFGGLISQLLIAQL